MSVNVNADTAVNNALQHSTGLSSKEQTLLAGLSGADRERVEAQLMLQKQQETVSFISKALKNETTMQVINALGR